MFRKVFETRSQEIVDICLQILDCIGRIDRFQIGVVSKNELITVSNFARNFLPHRL